MFRKLIMNKILLRNMGLIYGEINNYDNEPGKFTAYFQYAIGPYQEDFVLHFPKTPSAILNYNSIFLKLLAYNPQDAVKFIEYNYEAYADKKDFLLFLKRQLQYRINDFRSRRSAKRLTLCNIALEWAEEQLTNFKDKQKIIAYNQFVRNDLTIIVKNELQKTTTAAGDISVDQLTEHICASLQQKLGSIVDQTESKLVALADKYETGDIQLANLHMKDKLITLLLALKNLSGKATRNNKSGEPLFTKMDLNDIAQILRLHFSMYKGLKIDSIEKRIYEVNNNLKSDDPAY